MCTFLTTEAIISRVSLRGRPQVLRHRRRLEYLSEFLELGIGHVYRRQTGQSADKPPATFTRAETTHAGRRISRRIAVFQKLGNDVGRVRVSSGARRRSSRELLHAHVGSGSRFLPPSRDRRVLIISLLPAAAATATAAAAVRFLFDNNVTIYSDKRQKYQVAGGGGSNRKGKRYTTIPGGFFENPPSSFSIYHCRRVSFLGTSRPPIRRHVENHWAEAAVISARR